MLGGGVGWRLVGVVLFAIGVACSTAANIVGAAT
jgi:hypothetical protein